MCVFCLFRKKSAEHELRELLREKEEQISGLMEEGEKIGCPASEEQIGQCFTPRWHLPGEQLSKQQLTSNNIIKKLRGKDKQTELLLASQR